MFATIIDLCNCWLLFTNFFDFGLSFEDDFDLFITASFTPDLLNSDIIFSVSLEFISLEVSLILI